MERWKKVQEFVEEKFWHIEVVATKSIFYENPFSLNSNSFIDEETAVFSWNRNHFFDRHACIALYEPCVATPQAKVVSLQRKETKK